MHNVGDEATAHPAVQHLDALTSLRFFAALYVLMFHYTSISGSIFEGQVVRLGYPALRSFSSFPASFSPTIIIRSTLPSQARSFDTCWHASREYIQFTCSRCWPACRSYWSLSVK